MLQLDVISNGEHLNSGIFFRDLPGQLWQGYEAQIRNEWQGYSNDPKQAALPEDREKPVDYGTGGVYNRQPTRKVVSSDHEWFTYTITADGAACRPVGERLPDRRLHRRGEGRLHRPSGPLPGQGPHRSAGTQRPGRALAPDQSEFPQNPHHRTSR